MRLHSSQTIGTHQKKIQWTLVPNLVNILHFTFIQVILCSQLQQHKLGQEIPPCLSPGFIGGLETWVNASKGSTCLLACRALQYSIVYRYNVVLTNPRVSFETYWNDVVFLIMLQILPRLGDLQNHSHTGSPEISLNISRTINFSKSTLVLSMLTPFFWCDNFMIICVV